MAAIKKLLNDLINLVSNYIWENGTVFELDEFIQEEIPQYYGFYLENRELIIDEALEILKGI